MSKSKNDGNAASGEESRKQTSQRLEKNVFYGYDAFMRFHDKRWVIRADLCWLQPFQLKGGTTEFENDRLRAT